MGICSSCFGGSSEELIETPSVEARRQLQIEAAERRRQENESRGIKDVEKVRRQQMLQEKRDNQQAAMGEPVLKWQAD
ncbi:small VCP/p97-interacting protein [Phlebotomus argentipes]|uniref:small VCP/p97-interacting protein n=1 Tax=Phlebotomus argentipes TaxID=94469 RepID=UPI002892BE26|nr:small VCP/p97-interacting protein [Phlebotomus argentipes]